MSEPLQLPMFFSEAPPVKAGQQPETDSAKAILETSGLICCDWYSSQGRDVSLLKMCVEELAKDISTLFAADWKLRVTKRKRSYILLRWSVRPTSVSAFSLWPTPTASDNLNRAPSKNPAVTSTGSIRHQNKAGDQSFMRLSQVVKMYNTPRANDHRVLTLSPSEAKRESLIGDVIRIRMYSTPQARDFTNPSKPTDGRIQRKLEQGWTIDLNDQVQFDSPPGYANPEWWEAMMGLPPGWTALSGSTISPITWAYRNMLTNRRARSAKKSRTTQTASKRPAIRLSGGRRIR